MLRRRLQVHLQRRFSMDFDRAAPSRRRRGGVLLQIAPPIELLQCYSRPDPAAAMHG